MQFPKGKRYNGFLVTKAIPLPEINVFMYELIHEQSGACVIHLDTDDKENCFCLGFQTLPSSSNGVAHILEHLVLCGSKKYPINDPFFSMSRRSMNTFMNAMTGADFTLYLASSQIESDFYHLLDVYLDAVFFPELKQLSFLQEGHRLEFTNPTDPTTPLTYQGVVYNEMKGAMSSINSRLWKKMLHQLYPDLPYAHNSGGDPEEIPSLSYEELQEFYQNYYHPSHCLFYFYGDLPLKKHLDFLEEKLLSGVEKTTLLSPIEEQKRFADPKICHEHYPIGKEENLEKKTIFALGFLTCHVQDQDELLAISLLESILMEHDASPLKHRLFSSSLVGSFDSYIDVEMSEIPWVFVMKGLNEEDIPAIKELFFQSLEGISKEKISKELIEAALHQLEFHRLEITEEGLPHGFHLFFRSGLIKLHGCEAEDGLQIHGHLASLKKKIKDPSFLPDLIQKYLLSNHHRVELTVAPDPQLADREAEAEKKTLQKIEAALKEEEKKKIIEQSIALQKYQESLDREKINLLPILQMDEIPKKSQNFPLHKEKINNLPLYYHECFTNQVTYVDLAFDLSILTDEEMALLSLFSHFLTEVGCGKKSYRQMLDEMNRYTGGIEAFLSFNIQTDDPKSFAPTFMIRGKALHRNSAKLFSLLEKITHSAEFYDKQRIKELLIHEKTELDAKQVKNAMHYAISLSLSPYSYPQRLKNLWYGQAYYRNIEKLCQDIDNSVDYLADLFTDMRDKIFQYTPSLILACDEKHYNHLHSSSFYEIARDSTPHRAHLRKDKGLDPTFTSAGYLVSSPVAFISRGFQTVTYTNPHAPSLAVMTELMNDLYLHEEIREKGGAYGSDASYNPQSGSFFFTSYRDPNLASTLHAFDKAVEKMEKGDFHEQQLYEGKLGVLQHLDSPLSPGVRGYVAYSWHKTKKTLKEREEYRHKILHLSKKDIQEAAQKAIRPHLETATTVAFAGKAFFEKENTKLKKPLPIKVFS